MAVTYTGINDCSNAGVSYGGAGCTYYANTFNPYLANQNSAYTVSWTGTQPRCYVMQNNIKSCNLSFDLAIASNTAANDVGVQCVMNNNCNMGTFYHSRIQGHDITDIVDLTQYTMSGGAKSFNDSGANTLVFTNLSTVGVYIDNLRIMRQYGMCYLPCDQGGTASTCYKGQNCNAQEQCSPGTVTYGGTGSLDAGRNDTPCNYESAHCMSMTSAGTLIPANSSVWVGNPVSWTLTNPGYNAGQAPNYAGPAICFFNLNNVSISPASANNDVAFQFNLNGPSNSIATYYNSRVPGHNSAAGIDLVKYPQYYNDAPLATNTLKLSLYDSSTTLYLIDTGGINVYRVYNVTNPVQ